MILDAWLEPGQRLPSKRALSEALAVRGPSMREALRSLKAMSFLQNRVFGERGLNSGVTGFVPRRRRLIDVGAGEA